LRFLAGGGATAPPSAFLAIGLAEDLMQGSEMSDCGAKGLALEKAGDFQAHHSGQAARDIFYLLGELFIDSPVRLVHRR
jgi:hypothetical protein